MITSLAQYIAGVLLRNDIVESKKLDIYIYGFEIAISSVISILIGLIIGIAFMQIIECVIFLVIFIVLRQYCGGYHASSYFKCNLVFAVNLILAMLIMKAPIDYPMYIYAIICSLCIAVIALFAPIENLHKPIPKSARKKYKITALLLSTLFAGMAIAAYYFNPHYCIVINTAVVSVAVSMIIEKLRKEGDTNEKGIEKDSSQPA